MGKKPVKNLAKTRNVTEKLNPASVRIKKVANNTPQRRSARNRNTSIKMPNNEKIRLNKPLIASVPDGPCTSSPQEENEGEKLHALPGCMYQVQMCIYLFVYAKIKDLKEFEIQIEVGDAGKFDDVVIKNDEGYIFFQIKHCNRKDDESLKITAGDILSVDDKEPYSLLKYIESVQKITLGKKFKNIEAAYLFTNRYFHLDEDNKIQIDKRIINKYSISSENHIKLKENKNNNNNIIDFSKYKEEFTLENLNLFNFSEENKTLIEILTKQSPSDKLKKKKDISDEIREALKYIIFAVGQPNESDFGEIIQGMLKDHFFIISDYKANSFYLQLKNRMENWCGYKYRISKNQEKLSIIDKNVREFFFEEHLIKDLSPLVADPPVTNFVGRKAALNEMEKRLKKSNWLLITGLTGMGKTELVKRFCQQHRMYKKSVVWIEAESADRIIQSLKSYSNIAYVDKLNLIDHVCESVKKFCVAVLFVFDNFKNETLSMKYIRRIKSKNFRFSPAFIVTSRDAGCLKNINDVNDKLEYEKLNLESLSETEAIELLETELTTVNYKTNEKLKKLASFLLFIPEALISATNCINKDKSTKNEIENYLKKSTHLKHLKPLWTTTVEGFKKSYYTNKVLENVRLFKTEMFQFSDIEQKMTDIPNTKKLQESISTLVNYHVLIKTNDLKPFKNNKLTLIKFKKKLDIPAEHF